MKVIAWLDLHAGAVQALAALIAAVLTGLVATLTWKYVGLTRLIANSATRQTETAQLEADTASALQRVSEAQLQLARAHEQAELARRSAAIDQARQHLSSLCRNILNHFAPAFRDNPQEQYFRDAAPFPDGYVDLLRDASSIGENNSFESTELIITALNFMQDLQTKIRSVSKNYGYAFNATEIRMYVENLRVLREECERWTEYRPPSI